MIFLYYRLANITLSKIKSADSFKEVLSTINHYNGNRTWFFVIKCEDENTNNVVIDSEHAEYLGNSRDDTTKIILNKCIFYDDLRKLDMINIHNYENMAERWTWENVTIIFTLLISTVSRIH